MSTAVVMASATASCSEQLVISPSVLAKIDFNSWVDSDLFDLGSIANKLLRDEVIDISPYGDLSS